MTLPQNKYPYIPPDADYDPGAPVVTLPPGVAPGPGPALTPPYPLQVPPNTPGHNHLRYPSKLRPTRPYRPTDSNHPAGPAERRSLLSIRPSCWRAAAGRRTAEHHLRREVGRLPRSQRRYQRLRSRGVAIPASGELGRPDACSELLLAPSEPTFGHHLARSRCQPW